MSGTQEVGEIFGAGRGASNAMLRSPTVLIASVGLWGMNIYLFKLFSIDYSIGLQEVYKPSFLPNLGNFRLNRSVMSLKLDMLHEGDMLAIIDGLHEQTTPFIVRDCKIQRPIGAVVNTKNIAANMQAECEIDWLTLRDPQLSSATTAEAL